MPLTIYGAPLSPFVRKVLIIAEHKGLPHELVPAAPGRLPEGYLEISPLGKIPALRDGDFTVSDSSVIAQYLEEKYPERSLMPATPELRARARWFEEYADTVLAECTGLHLFFERIMKPVFMKQPTDEARVERALTEKLPKALDYLETQAPASGFLFGDALSLGDVSVVVQFINARIAGVEIDAARWPATAAWLKRVEGHPAVANRLQLEAPVVAMVMAKKNAAS